jgi:hypothetical protein
MQKPRLSNTAPWPSCELILEKMQFEAAGVYKRPGVFCQFETFRDFWSWLSRAYGLGDVLKEFAYYENNNWYSPCLAAPFKPHRFYAVRREGHPDFFVRWVDSDAKPRLASATATFGCCVQ